MQKKLGIVLISLAIASSALGQAARYIDPMLGVDGGGNTFPGPSLPFGMSKPGPDIGDNKGNAGWKAKGDINGFSQTHVNGSGGGPKYGNILIQPTTGITRAGNYGSPRADEQASVGYYRVTLARYRTNVEITTASRAAIYRFTYPATEAKNILFDVSHMLSTTNDYGEAQTLVSSSIQPMAMNLGRELSSIGRASGDMAKSRDEHLWAMAHAERTALAEDLSSLNAEQWRHDTLCGKWDVEEVVAHMAAAASLNQWRWVRSMLGARFRGDVHNQRRMAEYRGDTPAETLDRFRSILGSATAPSGHTPAYLGEVVVHAQDIRQPLGLPRTPDTGALTPVADFYARRNFTVASRTTVAGLQLRADDRPFATGTGPLVTGSTLALVISMAGRAPYVDQLDGPGVSTLRARVNGTEA